MRKAYTIQSGLVAILIYILIILIIVWAFVENKKKTQFSRNNEQIIRVDMSTIDSLSSSQSFKTNIQNQESTKEEITPKQEEKISQESKKQVEEKTQEAPKKIQQETAPKEKLITDKKPIKEIAKTINDITSTQNQELTKKEKTIQKEKISQESKKNREEKIEKISKNTTQEIVKPQETTLKEKLITDKKPIKEIAKTTNDTTSSLFNTIDAKAPLQVVKKTQTTTQKQITSNLSSNLNTQVSKKASDLINSSLLANSNSVEDGYKSKVKSILNGWPAQSDFAGNKAKIKFIIEPSGRFEFEVINSSSSEKFNKELVQYIKQLQKVGFGAHGGNRAYIFDVDFIAE